MRSILHVDMDAFYASVEQRDQPELRGRPVIVGGDGSRGVVAAASYEARRHGIHSAMPSVRARRLCPDAVFIRPRMDHYAAVSRQIFGVFHDFTPAVEGLSLDEAFLDVTSSLRLFGSAEAIARQVRQRIAGELGLVASVGVASNKYLAKLASDRDKPDGLTVVRPGEEQAFLDPLPVGRIWGIGPRAAQRLQAAGIRTVQHLRGAPAQMLSPILGNRTEHFLRLARGEDSRPVVPSREDKSISAERTFGEDLQSESACRRELMALADRVCSRVRAAGLSPRTLFIKIRTADFKTVTRSTTVAGQLDGLSQVSTLAGALMNTWWAECGPASIRLLGVGLSHFADSQQADLFGNTASSIDRLGDEVRRRFGRDALTRARLLERDD